MDRELADIAQSFRFLLDVTPVNVEAARHGFLAGRDDEPGFQYRLLEGDPSVILKRLEAVDVDGLADPTLAHLLHAKHRELELQLAMLQARGTPDFRALSIELFGTVSPMLLDQAERLLAGLSPARETGPWVNAETFACAAREEFDHYRAIEPDLGVHVEVRDDCAGVMVEHGELLVPSTLRLPARRVEALLHHEIGTHVITYLNGCRQPMRVLACGLAGYEETQEGLAVLAEYLAGALTIGRIRQLAARVVAVHQLTEGRSFREMYDSLVERGFAASEVFSIVMRVRRGGGLTKDAVYLRGLNDLVRHLGERRSIEVLWVGKMPLSAAPLVEDLIERGVLTGPRLRPRYLDDAEALARLERLERAQSVDDLLRSAV